MSAHAYALISYCRTASLCISDATISAYKSANAPDARHGSHVGSFFYYRYDSGYLQANWPHKTFSVEEASLDFFNKTLDYLELRVKVPDKEKGNDFKNNYIDWLNTWKKEERI